MALLFETDERGIEGALIQLEEVFGDLLQAGGDGIGMLLAHGLEHAEDDEIERALQNGNAIFVFTWHSSGPLHQDKLASLECQVISARRPQGEEKAIFAERKRRCGEEWAIWFFARGAVFLPHVLPVGGQVKTANISLYKYNRRETGNIRCFGRCSDAALPVVLPRDSGRAARLDFFARLHGFFDSRIA